MIFRQTTRQILGEEGEKIALSFLKKQGYKIKELTFFFKNI